MVSWFPSVIQLLDLLFVFFCFFSFWGWVGGLTGPVRVNLVWLLVSLGSVYVFFKSFNVGRKMETVGAYCGVLSCSGLHFEPWLSWAFFFGGLNGQM